MTPEERQRWEDHQLWLRRIEDKLDRIIVSGCAKAATHDDHEQRLRDIERQQSEGRGKAALAGGIASVIVSMVAVAIGKLFK